MFSFVAMWNLAYLGCPFDSSGEEEKVCQISIYSFDQSPWDDDLDQWKWIWNPSSTQWESQKTKYIFKPLNTQTMNNHNFEMIKTFCILLGRLRDIRIEQFFDGLRDSCKDHSIYLVQRGLKFTSARVWWHMAYGYFSTFVEAFDDQKEDIGCRSPEIDNWG